MRILYAIQGTGIGHFSRAESIIPHLKKRGEVDVLISGVQSDLDLPFEVKYKFKGLGFVFGKRGGVDLWDTYRNLDMRTFWFEIRSLPIEDYDLVVNDFEPVSAWAAKILKVPCFALSHQYAVLDQHTPKSDKPDLLSSLVLRRYAPSDAGVGFHFKRFTPNIYTPVIRDEVRKQEIKKMAHYTVYLSAYSDEKIYKRLSQIEHVRWEVFSKESSRSYSKKNVFFFPIDDSKFVKSMATSAGVLCGAGFETPAEALFMGKKLFVIPMKNQMEQQCNAAAMRQMGVQVVKSFKKKHLPTLRNWVNHGKAIKVDYTDQTHLVVEAAISWWLNQRSSAEEQPAMQAPNSLVRVENYLAD